MRRSAACEVYCLPVVTDVGKRQRALTVVCSDGVIGLELAVSGGAPEAAAAGLQTNYARRNERGQVKRVTPTPCIQR